MFRFLGRLLVALFVLFFLRLFFVAMRRAISRGRRASGATPVGGAAGARKAAGRPAPPRIDRSAAEDVPFVEVESERAARS
ncbi:MAG TPA: hypothetical protein VLT84_10510 [Acidobacteriota bacterium]|nr:hypothetical protein [Acidobacteriota bacterium]